MSARTRPAWHGPGGLSKWEGRYWVVIGYKPLQNSRWGKVWWLHGPRRLGVILATQRHPYRTETREEYPRAEIATATDAFPTLGATGEIVQRIEGKQPRLRTFPLDMQATVVQRRVWQETAADITARQKTRLPFASRAIPRPAQGRGRGVGEGFAPRTLCPSWCLGHRVIREDGKLDGYRWGELSRTEHIWRRERATGD